MTQIQGLTRLVIGTLSEALQFTSPLAEAVSCHVRSFVWFASTEVDPPAIEPATCVTIWYRRIVMSRYRHNQ
jgi:hypothetical protein